MDDRISRIRAKLARAAAAPELQQRWGVHRHGYRLNHPTSEECVAHVEELHGVTLPEAYRRFLLELGDGGAGPGLGIVPLGTAHDWDDQPTGYLATPSALASGDAHTRDWHDYPELRQGALTVADLGSEDVTQLIVTGPGSGTLVNVSLAGWSRPVLAEDPDFLSWYERWLDELLGGCDTTRFGDKLPGDETVLAEILAHDPSAHRRVRAARSLVALPSTGRVGADGINAAIADPDPEIRVAALRAVRGTRNADCEARTRDALADPAADVRAAAMSALSGLGSADVAERARERLGDDGPDVVRQAVCALRDAKVLTVGDLAPLVAGAPAELRRLAVDVLVEAEGDATTLLAQSLVDEDPVVRQHAVRAADAAASVRR